MIEVGQVWVSGIEYGVIKTDLIVFEHPGLLSMIASDDRVTVFQQRKSLSRVFYFKKEEAELQTLFKKWKALQ